MSTRPEHWILCGGASHADAPSDALRLAASGDSKNLTVDVQGITKALTGQVPPEFRDLILIAAYVFAADQAFSRGASDDTDMGDKWRRSFRFVIGVERPDLWSSPEMQRLLESALCFLSDDYYAFEFVKGTDRPSEQLCLSTPKGEPLISWDHISEIVLFSGGLDSLGGVADQFLRQEHNVIAVSHRSADKTYSTQRWLLEEMRKLAPKRGIRAVALRPDRRSVAAGGPVGRHPHDGGPVVFRRGRGHAEGICRALEAKSEHTGPFGQGPEDGSCEGAAGQAARWTGAVIDLILSACPARIRPSAMASITTRARPMRIVILSLPRMVWCSKPRRWSMRELTRSTAVRWS
jgi:hypothetical protein